MPPAASPRGVPVWGKWELEPSVPCLPPEADAQAWLLSASPCKARGMPPTKLRHHPARRDGIVSGFLLWEPPFPFNYRPTGASFERAPVTDDVITTSTGVGQALPSDPGVAGAAGHAIHCRQFGDGRCVDPVQRWPALGTHQCRHALYR